MSEEEAVPPPNEQMQLTQPDGTSWRTRVTDMAGRPIGGDERAMASLLLAIGPLLSAVAAAGGAHLVGVSNGGGVAHFVALSLGWFVGALLVVRELRRRRSDRPSPSSAHLLLAAAASFIAAVGLAVMTAPWQELMSEPAATPLMVAKDVTSTLAPLVACVCAPWCVLTAWRSSSCGHRY